MKTVPSLRQHVTRVMDNLSDQHQREHDAFSLCRKTVEDQLFGMVNIGKADTILHKGEPVAVLAAAKAGDVNTTWFIATKAYFAIGPRAIRHAKRYVRALSDRIGPIVISTRVNCPETDRWMKIIGWKKFGGEEGLSVFVYR